MKYKRESIQKLIEKIPRRGMSVDCQKFLEKSNIIANYLEGKSLNESKKSYPTKGVYVEKIYHVLEGVKMNGLKKIADSLSKHPNDINEGAVFVDSVIRYCVSNGLEKEVEEELGLEKNFLDRRYRPKKKQNNLEDIQEQNNSDMLLLKDLSNKHDIYNFILRKIL